MAIYGQKSINGRVEWLGVPAPFYNTGVAWTGNILVPSPLWGDGGGYKRWALETRYRPRFRVRSVPWCGAVPFRPNYVSSSTENGRTRACRIRDVCLLERHLARDQTLLRDLHFDGDEWGNESDASLDSWVDE